MQYNIQPTPVLTLSFVFMLNVVFKDSVSGCSEENGSVKQMQCLVKMSNA